MSNPVLRAAHDAMLEHKKEVQQAGAYALSKVDLSLSTHNHPCSCTLICIRTNMGQNMLSDEDKHTWYNQLSLGMHICNDCGMCSPEYHPEKVNQCSGDGCNKSFSQIPGEIAECIVE